MTLGRCSFIVLAAALGSACNLDLGLERRGPSERLRGETSGPSTRHLDTDGNDSWEQAPSFTASAGRAISLPGQLGEVDPEGVLDQVDYYRLQARHSSLLVLVEGEVDVDLVTANDVVVTSPVRDHLWFDDLSVDGGYALSVRPAKEGSVSYTLLVAAGAHVLTSCEATCRFGLACVRGLCAQAGLTGDACLHHGDCAQGACVNQVCGGDDDRCDVPTDDTGCLRCEDDEDCHLGSCYDGYCLLEDWSCETARDAGERCRGGRVQRCVAGQWSDAGRCDTGCLEDRCAPPPNSCQIEGALLCMDDAEAVCDGGSWQTSYHSSGICDGGGGLEGASCESDAGCLAPLTCMPTGLEPDVTRGVCALPCDSLDAECHDGKRCGALLYGGLFCLQPSSGSCDLASLRGCSGAVAGACVEGSCFPSCYPSSCPGAGCACTSGIDCLPLDSSGIGATVGLCLSVVPVGGSCGEQRFCDDDAVCVLEQEGDVTGICRALCHGSCPSGETCVPLTNDMNACLPAA